MKIHLQDTDGTLHEYAVPTIDEVSVGQWMAAEALPKMEGTIAEQYRYLYDLVEIFMGIPHERCRQIAWQDITTITAIVFTLFVVLLAALVTTLRKAERQAKLLKDKEREIIFHINKHKRMADRLTERYNALKELGEVSEGQRRIIRDMTRVNAELNQRIADLEAKPTVPTTPEHGE